MTFGTDVESAADVLLSSNNDTITQQCEQSLSSINGNCANYAINTAQDNDIESGNQANQQSKQKIGNRSIVQIKWAKYTADRND